MATPRTGHTNISTPVNIPPTLTTKDSKWWTREEFQSFLKYNQTAYDLDDKDIDLIKKGKASGPALATLTKDVLETGYGLSCKGAIAVAELVDNLRKPQVVGEAVRLTSGEMAELRRLRALVKGVNKFDLVISSKPETSFQWLVCDIEQATIADLRDRIFMEYPGLVEDNLHFDLTTNRVEQLADTNTTNGTLTYSPRTDQQLRRVLSFFAAKNIKEITVKLTSPVKLFSDWTLEEVCRFYKIGKGYPNLSQFPVFNCGSTRVNKKILSSLMVKLKGLLSTTPYVHQPDAARSIYLHCFLHAAVWHFNTQSTPQFFIRVKNEIRGVNGRGPVDYVIELCGSGMTRGITVRLLGDFRKGVAQNAVQMESLLTQQKCVQSQDTSTPAPTRCFGIVSDAVNWLFLECTTKSGKPEFKLSTEYVVVYDGLETHTRIHAAQILGHILWMVQDEARRSLPNKKRKFE